MLSSSVPADAERSTPVTDAHDAALDLLRFSALQQQQFDASVPSHERKQRGHFGTPSAIARFMAGMFSIDITNRPSKRILDAGAGVGTLSAAVCERFAAEQSTSDLYFELWENDPKLIPALQSTMEHCQKSFRLNGQRMGFQIVTDDFILANPPRTLFGSGACQSFDMAILNPPYFKLRKDSAYARAMDHVVHGQPNIYALFLAVVADKLITGGELVAITPRSYFDGPYFKKFRKWFFSRAAARQIHVFESRHDAFKEDAVLQENVILHAQRGVETPDVVLSTSAGRDFSDIAKVKLPYGDVVKHVRGDFVIRVAASSTERAVHEILTTLPCRLHDLGCEISTGPVVTFRSKESLRLERAHDTAPLLWMHNVRPFRTVVAEKKGKPSHIEAIGAAKKLLVRANTYVLLKRFTAKEEKRRLVAGIVTHADSYSEWIGLENHLNYIYRIKGTLGLDEAFGLAAYFNSAIVDNYFRSISGNTQVNATEIRRLPLPDEALLHLIGRQVQSLNAKDSRALETIVCEALCVPENLQRRLIEADE